MRNSRKENIISLLDSFVLDSVHMAAAIHLIAQQCQDMDFGDILAQDLALVVLLDIQD